MVHIRLLNHGAHRMLDGAVCKLIVRVLFPNGLEIKVRPVHARLEELQAARVRYRLGVVVEVLMGRCGESPTLRGGVTVLDKGAVGDAGWGLPRLAGDVSQHRRARRGNALEISLIEEDDARGNGREAVKSCRSGVPK